MTKLDELRAAADVETEARARAARTVYGVWVGNVLADLYRDEGAAQREAERITRRKGWGARVKPQRIIH